DSLWAADFPVMPERVETVWQYDADVSPKRWETFFDPLMTLAQVAALTRTIRLGTGILVLPWRNPVLTAKELATLDVFCKGGLIVGVGTGWSRAEFEALGVKTFERRGAMLDEYLRILRLLWTEEVASFDGETYQLPPVRNRPKPVHKDGPPIWIGGNNAAALRRVASVGDGWQSTHLGPEDVAKSIRAIRELPTALGRDPSRIHMCARCQLGVPSSGGLGGSISSNVPSRLYGSLDSIRERLAQFRDAGCDSVVLEVGLEESKTPVLESLESFADKVMA